MARNLLVAEIGSTITKLKLLSLSPHPRIVARGESPSTVVAGDVTLGLQGAMNALKARLNETGDDAAWLKDCPMCASSSAAGGLRMTVHGLVYDMTVRAAREAALGAGANLSMVTSGKLHERQLDEIASIRPNIVLLTGGTEHGDVNTVIHNAHQLAKLSGDIPIVYAGNSVARQEVLDALGTRPAGIRVIDNVYPRLDQLNIEPTRRVIQEVFEEHIVHAPGMARIGEMVTGKILPTPGAVMEATKLLAQDVGDVLVIDMGGATTDVHSVTEGSDDITSILANPEPVAKRTVEGDLGLFVCAKDVIRLLGREVVCRDLGFDVGDLPKNAIPVEPEEKALVAYLAQEIVSIAVRRHAGTLKHLYGAGRRITIAEGKDLTKIQWVIGTGGFMVHWKEGADVLRRAITIKKDTELMPPPSAQILIDHDYVLSTAGLNATSYPSEALALMKSSLRVN